jgi:superfamily II DNA or RNA helicase
MKLYDYQKEIINQAATILQAEGIVYLALEMRLGKTFIALTLAKIFEAKRVVMLTKKKAIESIKGDYQKGGFGYEFEAVNYESASKVDLTCDLLILDEAHVLGTFPKPNDKTRLVRAKG